MSKHVSPPKAEASTSAPTPCAEPRVIGGKLGLIVALMRRPEGADLSDMMTATGWQQHSVRGALAGSLKRGHGLDIVSERVDGSRIYRICEPQPEPPIPLRIRNRKRAASIGASASETVDG